MQTNPVSATAGVAESPARAGLNRMKSEDFFRLLITELQQQDPLEPAKTSDMIGQVSQIRSIEVSGQLSTILAQLTRQQRMLGASELLGKLIEGEVVQGDGTRTLVSGVVTGVRFGEDGVAVLELDTGQIVRAGDVTRVTTTDPPGERSSGAAAKTLPSAAPLAPTADTQGLVSSV